MTRKAKTMLKRINKIKRRALLYRDSDSTQGIAFEYELSYDGDGYIIGISMTDKTCRSYIERRLSFGGREAAEEFFRLCVRGLVTPLNLEYVYEDYTSDEPLSDSAPL